MQTILFRQKRSARSRQVVRNTDRYVLLSLLHCLVHYRYISLHIVAHCNLQNTFAKKQHIKFTIRQRNFEENITQ